MQYLMLQAGANAEIDEAEILAPLSKAMRRSITKIFVRPSATEALKVKRKSGGPHDGSSRCNGMMPTRSKATK
jgi:hypothetical protein